jgi:Flp pilus assembly protein TadG
MIPVENVRLRRRRSQRGSTIIEFALVAFQLVLIMLALFEFSRMVLVTTTVANAARTGVRYAIVHGSTRTGTGDDGPSGPGQTSSVSATVNNFARAGLLDTNRLNIAVNYPDGNSDPGSRVRVTLSYPYDPFTVLPLGVDLRSTTEGVITF